ncbi:hypothetical protein C7S13_0167 [Burkholderia cepacia]|nr:hypothetical protein [Burkholderia cepacia]
MERRKLHIKFLLLIGLESCLSIAVQTLGSDWPGQEAKRNAAHRRSVKWESQCKRE